MQLPRLPSRHDIHAASGLLATQILVLFAVATLAPLVVALVQTQADAREAERHAFESSLGVAGVGAAGVEAIVRDAQQQARVLDRLPAFWNGADGDRDRILSAFVAAQPTFYALVYFTPDYQTHGNSNYDPAVGRGNAGRRAYAREAVVSGQLAVTDEALLAPGNPVPVLPVAVPLQEAGPAGRVGFLSAGLHIDRLTNRWADLPLPQGSTVMLLDTREGRILAGSGEMGSRVNQTIDAARLERIRAGDATFRLTAGDGSASLRAWQRVEHTPWVVAIDIPGAAVLDPIYAQADRRVLVNLGISVATGALLLLLWRRLSPRLSGLQQAAANWARGDWRYRTRIAGRDELGQLGMAFDGMAQQLQQQELERQKGEEIRSRLAAIVESSSDAILSKDLDGIITSWNRGAERLYGYAADEVIGRPVSILVPPALLDELSELMNQVKRGERIEDCETVRIARDGRPIDVSVSLSPIRDAAGTITAIAAITRDMSERRAVERLKDEFVSTVSHEIRTPMNGVIGMTSLLLNTELTPRQQGYAETIRQSGEALLTIIDDILDLSKIEAGKLELERTELDVRELVDSVAGLLAGQAEGKGLELAVFVHHDVPAELGGDPGRLRQILLNLVGNAVKFTERGEVVVRARLAAETPDEAIVRFEVVDTGIGISPEAQKRLFQPFSQTDSSTTRKYGGTGLGLVICKRLAALMGGEIGVESALGRGSTFWFTARFARTVASSPSTAGPTGLQGLRVLSSVGARILVAEDSPINQQVAVGILEALGYVVDVVANGRESVEALDRGPYAAVLMDCQMPVLDGFGASAEIRRRAGGDRDVPIIAVTAAAMKGERERCLAAGMNDYVAKPFRPDQLAAVLQRWIVGAESPAVGGPTHQPGSAAGAPVTNAVRDLAALDDADPELEGKLIALFLRDGPTRLAAIRAAVEQDDAPALVRSAHLLRGEASLLGARELEAIGGQLERLGRAATLEGTSALVEDLEAAFQRTATALRTRGAACPS